MIAEVFHRPRWKTSAITRVGWGYGQTMLSG
jgi:hypothetical protein